MPRASASASSTARLASDRGLGFDVLFLKETNANNVMTRPIWQLMFRLPMYGNCQKDEQTNAIFLEERIVNIPSSVR